MTLTDTAIETATHWARCLTAAAERRRAAIETLADAEAADMRAHDALTSIDDPTGIALVRDARNRAWAVPGSEIGGK